MIYFKFIIISIPSYFSGDINSNEKYFHTISPLALWYILFVVDNLITIVRVEVLFKTFHKIMCTVSVDGANEI